MGLAIGRDDIGSINWTSRPVPNLIVKDNGGVAGQNLDLLESD